MKIEKVTSRISNDFYAIYKCEYCSHEKKGSGYNDANFYENVIPNMECKSCGKKSIQTIDEFKC